MGLSSIDIMHIHCFPGIVIASVMVVRRIQMRKCTRKKKKSSIKFGRFNIEWSLVNQLGLQIINGNLVSIAGIISQFMKSVTEKEQKMPVNQGSQNIIHYSGLLMRHKLKRCFSIPLLGVKGATATGHSKHNQGTGHYNFFFSFSHFVCYDRNFMRLEN